MTQANKAYAAYASNKILTASPAELTLMLYEGAIKFANIAIAAMENNDVEKAHNNVIKVRNIILEFQSTLNYDFPVAQDFNNVYEYLKFRLTEANLHKEPEIMEEILGHLRTMRDTWKEVMELNKMAKAN
jgi:flagellar protein FliS